jgi:hypothetical protein
MIPWYLNSIGWPMPPIEKSGIPVLIPQAHLSTSNLSVHRERCFLFIERTPRVVLYNVVDPLCSTPANSKSQTSTPVILVLHKKSWRSSANFWASSYNSRGYPKTSIHPRDSMSPRQCIQALLLKPKEFKKRVTEILQGQKGDPA